jgi:hypothetical protein
LDPGPKFQGEIIPSFAKIAGLFAPTRRLRSHRKRGGITGHGARDSTLRPRKVEFRYGLNAENKIPRLDLGREGSESAPVTARRRRCPAQRKEESSWLNGPQKPRRAPGGQTVCVPISNQKNRYSETRRDQFFRVQPGGTRREPRWCLVGVTLGRIFAALFCGVHERI